MKKNLANLLFAVITYNEVIRNFTGNLVIFEFFLANNPFGKEANEFLLDYCKKHGQVIEQSPVELHIRGVQYQVNVYELDAAFDALCADVKSDDNILPRPSHCDRPDTATQK